LIGGRVALGGCSALPSGGSADFCDPRRRCPDSFHTSSSCAVQLSCCFPTKFFEAYFPPFYVSVVPLLGPSCQRGFHLLHFAVLFVLSFAPPMTVADFRFPTPVNRLSRLLWSCYWWRIPAYSPAYPSDWPDSPTETFAERVQTLAHPSGERM